jgi:hypothetical protein
MKDADVSGGTCYLLTFNKIFGSLLLVMEDFLLLLHEGVYKKKDSRQFNINKSLTVFTYVKYKCEIS